MSSSDTNSGTGSESNLNSPGKLMWENGRMIILALAALFGLLMFILTLHFYLKVTRRCERASAGGEFEPDISGRERSRRYQIFDPEDLSSSVSLALDQSVVDRLPTFVFNPEVPSKADMECAVCLQEFRAGERGRLLPKCGHAFHVECIDMWFMSHSSCPLCRCQVAPETIDFQPGIELPRFSLLRGAGLATPARLSNSAQIENDPHDRERRSAADSLRAVEVALDVRSLFTANEIHEERFLWSQRRAGLMIEVGHPPEIPS